MSGAKLYEFDIAGGRGMTVGNIRVYESAVGHKKLRIGPIELDPSMNPLRAGLELWYGASMIGSTQAEFRISMMNDRGVKIWEEHGFITKGSSGKRKVKDVHKTRLLPAFKVEKEGNYFFLCEIGRRHGTIYKAKFFLKRNVSELNFINLGIFLLPLVIGIILIYTSNKRKRTNEKI